MRVTLVLLLPMFASAQSLIGGSTPVLDSVLANSPEIRLLQHDVDLADLDVTRTDFFHTLIPRVSLSARVGQNSVFLLDPTHPWSFPSDAFSAVLTLDLDRIVNTLPHRQAVVKARQSRIVLQRRKAEMRQQLISLRTQIGIMDSLVSSLELKRGYRGKLVEAAELKYNAARISFEELVRARLDLADIDLEISTQKMKLSDLYTRLSALMQYDPDDTSLKGNARNR